MGKARTLANIVTSQSISADTAAVSGCNYVLTASLTLTLPAAPEAGDRVGIQNSSSTTTATIARNGNNIMSLAENMTFDRLDVGITLMYADSTRGWIIQ